MVNDEEAAKYTGKHNNDWINGMLIPTAEVLFQLLPLCNYLLFILRIVNINETNIKIL